MLMVKAIAPNRCLRRLAKWGAGGLIAVVLAGCYSPGSVSREPQPAPWPYEAGGYAPGRSFPAAPAVVSNNGYPAAYGGAPVAAAPAYGNGGAGPVSAIAPPPSQSIPAQYADWLFDGPEGRGFAHYLADGYRRYAKHEDNAHDFEDAAKFLARASAVDRGERVEPEQLGMRTLPAYAVDDLLYARQRLMAALNRGAALRLPKLAANAQVAFDCWMEQQEENIQPHDVAKCRRSFEGFVVRLEAALFEKQPAETVRCSTAVTCPTVSLPACDAQPAIVYFDLGRHELTSAGRAVLARVAEQAGRQGGKTPLVVTAHTDRSGSDAANDALSKRRLDTVVDTLAAAGISRDLLVRANYYGETVPRVPTADGVKLPENRRVELRFACAQTPVEASCQAAVSTGTCPPGGGQGSPLGQR